VSRSAPSGNGASDVQFSEPFASRERSSRVVFWDFDGTLAYREGMWRGALIEALTAVLPNHGVDADDVATGLRDCFPWHRPDIEHRHLDSADAWWAELEPAFERAYRRVGVAPQLASHAASLVRTRYCDPRRFTVFPDTRPALDRLALEGWRHVIVSNHVPELPQIVDALDLGDIIEAVVTSADTGYEKPNPKMFIEAVRRVEAPGEAWMVGDNPTADIAGARAVGIPAILVRNPDTRAGKHATLHDAVERIIESPQSGPDGAVALIRVGPR
jgi:putative hydrolase of the HAD superfamily